MTTIAQQVRRHPLVGSYFCYLGTVADENDIAGVNATAAGGTLPSDGDAANPKPARKKPTSAARTPRTTRTAAARSASTATTKRSGTKRAKTATDAPVLSTERSRARGERAARNPVLVSVSNLTKRYDDTIAANNVTIDVHQGSFFGIVGPNGAGKTTVLSILSGLNRPTSGTVTLSGKDVWANPAQVKPMIGILPDRLRLFDRLTGAQLLFYTGILYGLSSGVATERSKMLGQAFGLESALNRPVADYSVGMQKKIALACAMIHAPRLLVLDEPFEAIDPVSASTVTELLEKFVQAGGSVILSSHSLDIVQRTCDHVAIINEGVVVAQGTVDAVRDGKSLHERFDELTQAEQTQGAMEWLFRSSGSD